MTEEEKEKLYNAQVEMLRNFLKTGAITTAQFEKSYGDLTKKMFPDKEEQS